MKASNSFLAIIFLLSAGGSGVSADFAVQEESAGLASQIAVLNVEMIGAKQGNADGAVARLSAVWNGSGEALVRDENGSLQSIAGWFDGLPADSRALLQAAVDKAQSPRLAPAMVPLSGDPSTSPLDLYAKARSVPVATDTGISLAQAGDRALVWGDATSANDFYAMAREAGWTPEESRLSVATKATSPAAQVVPVASSWYGDSKSTLTPHIQIVRAGDLLIIPGIAGGTAVRDGAVAWTNTWGDVEDIASSAPVAGSAGRGPLLFPAVLSGAGAPQVVVFNTPVTMDLPGSLRAVRASDGHTLWDTRGDDSTAGSRFVGPATIRGRYVYAPVVRVDGTVAQLHLACLDVTDGRLLWSARLGSETSNERNRELNPLEHYWQQNAPLVTDRYVYVAPGVGYVFAIGRFDGKIRWARRYDAPAVEEQQLRHFRVSLRERRKETELPLPPSLVARYQPNVALAGDVVVAAPWDSPVVLGLKPQSGAVVWKKDQMEPSTLVGSVGSIAIFSGPFTSGINAGDGNVRWSTPADTQWGGAAAIAGDTILLPMSDGTRAARGDNGAISSSDQNVRTILQSPAVVPALNQIGAVQSLEPSKMEPKR